MSSIRNLRSLLLLPRRERESPEVVAAIRGLIEADRKALQYYVRWMFFETSLQWQISSESTERMEVVSLIRHENWRHRVISLLTLAIGFLIVSTGVHFWTRMISTSVPELEIARMAGFYESPTKTHWAGERTKQCSVVRHGERLQLLAGRFLMHLDSGATVACTAPVDLEVINDRELFVHSGDACVYVSERARGFRVNTEAVKVVDLGTLFGLHVDELGQTEIHVLEGKVTGETSNHPALEINAGLSRSARMGESLSDPVPASAEKFASQLRSLAGVADTTDSIEFLQTSPESVCKDALVSSNTSFLFQERSKFELKEGLEIAAAKPGRFHLRRLPERFTLPVETVVSTYLLHASNSGTTPLTGEIHFHGRILGFALSADQLNATDAQCGHPNVRYPTSNDEMAIRGTIYHEERDWIEISNDRSKLKFQIADSPGTFDQIRIFVSEN